MNITSKIDSVTLFPRGAEITRLAQVELSEGEHQLRLTDLPLGLVGNSLRVEGKGSAGLELGAVDMRTVHIPTDEKRLDPDERQLLEKRIEKLEDEARRIDGRLASAQTRRTMMNNLAAMPAQSGAARGQNTDWAAIHDLIGDRLPKVHDEIVALEIERREMQEKIDDLRDQLNDQPQTPKQGIEVLISAKAGADLKGELTIRYQAEQAGWLPFYDARLTTNTDEDEPLIDLVRRARIHQNTGEPWQDVALTLSTTRPSGGTSAPELFAQVLDILPDHLPVPMARGLRQKQKVMSAPVGAVATAEMAMEPPAKMMMVDAVETDTPVEQSGFQASFSVPGRVSLEGKGAQKKVRIGAEQLKPRLQIRSTPMLDPTAFLHAEFELTGQLALLPGEVVLYRDNIYVGNGQMPLVNVGERHELGFGVDDKVSIKRVEVKRSKGKHGLIKSENTDEFHFQISVTNHHSQMMPVRILDRIPASNHEKLKVETLREMSEATTYDVEDKRGVLAFERDLSAGSEEIINIHYRVSWPEGEQIG